MEEFIIEKIKEIYNDFRGNIDGTLCYLKNFNFRLDNLPDYNNENIQRYYLLKYMLGYFCEYYIIYRELINTEFLNENYKILSIGCGCGIDFWGLKLAKQLHKENLNINYTGLDIVEWLYMDDCGENKVYFLNQDISYINTLDEDDYNIIIFPKSIGEFDEITFNNLKIALRNTSFTEDNLVLISSLRSSRADYDKNRISEIINVLSNNHNYVSIDDPQKHLYFLKKDNGYDYRLQDIIDGLEYPKYINEYITTLQTQCENYNNCDEYDCEQLLGRHPISTMSQAKFQIIRLKRN